MNIIEQQLKKFEKYTCNFDIASSVRPLIRDFIKQSMLLAIKEERERIVEEIREIESDLQGHQAYTAVVRIIKLIQSSK